MLARAPTVSALDVGVVSSGLVAAENAAAGRPPVAPPPGAPQAFAPPAPGRRSGAVPWIVAGAVAVVAVGAVVVAIVARGGREFPRAVPEEGAPLPASPADTAPEPGGPILVDGTTLTLTSVTQPEAYVDEFDGSTYTPPPGDALLVVEGIIEGPVKPVQDWEVSVSDEQGRTDSPGLTVTTEAPGKPGDVTWVFTVGGTSGSFTLQLPGGLTTELSPLLTS
jgi:hypothetical protein